MVVRIIVGEGQEQEDIFYEQVKSVTRFVDGAEVKFYDDTVVSMSDPGGVLMIVWDNHGNRLHSSEEE
jgi:hypothetical protein